MAESATTALRSVTHTLALPTEAELYEICSAKYAQAASTYLDNWPQEWRDLSMETSLVALYPDCINEMWGAHDGLREFPALTKLALEIDAACNWDQRFIRLNTRSPKDVVELPVTCAGRQALHWLMSSERAMHDLSMLSHAKKPAYIALRKFVWIYKPSELRCFVRDGKLVAICQYHYGRAQRTWQSQEARSDAWRTISQYWKDRVHPPSPLQSYVFDIALQRETPLLIEVNPYGLSDPCAGKSYEQIESGGFFYVKAEAP